MVWCLPIDESVLAGWGAGEGRRHRQSFWDLCRFLEKDFFFLFVQRDSSMNVCYN